jgi:DNA modification methylase
MNQILIGDCKELLKTLPDKSVNCCVTSPPYYGLRDYGVNGQIGLERSPDAYVAELVKVFREVWRVLRDDGTLWLNIGDCYSGSGIGNIRPKNLVGIPWRVAFALQADGWYLRSDIIWHKPNPMPESVTDRPTRSHEYIFLLSKSERYYYDYEAIKEPAAWERWGKQTVKKGNPGTVSWLREKTKEELANIGGENPKTRNKRDVWTVATQGSSIPHFAMFPEKLIEPCILAGCPEGGTVLDPFFGAGTTGVVAVKHLREYIGIELNPEYAQIAEMRAQEAAGLFNFTEAIT